MVMRLLLSLCLALAACSASSAPISTQSASKIVVDQFGYLPELEKRAVIRSPEQGYDAEEAFTPGKLYAVIDTRSGQTVYQGAPTPWRGGQVDETSGDRTWWFDFSSVTKPGSYVVRDVERRVDSFEFEINDRVYTPVLKAAFKTFYLQRAGIEKRAPFAPSGFSDKASHLGPGQDGHATLYNRKRDRNTARDVRGGWYDAGDYNKYTNWTANYVISLLHAYDENPSVWTDDFDIPESGNGIPDILDEVKWGLDWLSRMQNRDGSVLSIVSLAEGSPPSSAKGPSHYGPPNTSAALTSAGAFALAAKIYGKNQSSQQQVSLYKQRAELAWSWAERNPNIVFKNNDAGQGSEGLGAGQQEVDNKGRQQKRLLAASYLFALTSDPRYTRTAEQIYGRLKPIDPYYTNAFDADLTFTLAYLSRQPRLSARFRNRIKTDFKSHVTQADNGLKAVTDGRDPYGAHIQEYTWGSNAAKSRKGSIFTQAIINGVGGASNLQYKNAASHYLHYLHGVNPLGKSYLSSMQNYGAENPVRKLYHGWFSGNTRPAPGFLVGGPNPYYERDECCHSSCGGQGDKLCRLPTLSPPAGQPAAKSYTDFNDGWPLNSWQITENSNGYQTAYIRLLSKFAR